MSKPRFITIEGGEGGGKSTQVARLAGRLRTAGMQVVATREPGGAEGAEMIRKLLVEGDPGRWDPMSELLLHFAARRDHLRRTVWPALERGQWVISDRFADSTMAYQGIGQGLGRDVVEQLNRLVLGDFRPDLTLILDVPVEKGLKRAVTRGMDNRYERMDKDFHERLRQGFLDIARREPERCVVIDATHAADEIAEEIAALVRERLGARI
ncbi:MAG: dTMP kinase [Alphaproteobacteria bacterium]|nr:dTMP kinase [Alphaproteobacteria bacterium]